MSLGPYTQLVGWLPSCHCRHVTMDMGLFMNEQFTQEMIREDSNTTTNLMTNKVHKKSMPLLIKPQKGHAT